MGKEVCPIDFMGETLPVWLIVCVGLIIIVALIVCLHSLVTRNQDSSDSDEPPSGHYVVDDDGEGPAGMCDPYWVPDDPKAYQRWLKKHGRDFPRT